MKVVSGLEHVNMKKLNCTLESKSRVVGVKIDCMR